MEGKLVTSCLTSLNSLLDIGLELYNYWAPQISRCLWRPNEHTKLLKQLPKAATFEEWHEIAFRLDRIQGNDIWRADPVSPYYDYKLISSLEWKLNQLRKHQRLDELAEVVRSGLMRNMGSIAASELYTCAYAGTKSLIESYVVSVCDSLVYLSRSAMHTRNFKARSTEAAEFKTSVKTFFKNSQQSYGRTALILQSGSLFGLCHLGVIKSLLVKQLLPNVICGATVGSIVAAYVCSVAYEDLEEAISRVPLQIMSYESTIACGNDNEEGINNTSDLPRYSLFTKEVMMFLNYVLDHLGDMTFEEAYVESGRILNILVLPAGSASSCFYNYLTTPKVIVRSAVLASNGSNMLPGYPDVNLLVKDHKGNIQPHPDGPLEYFPANHKTYLPPRESPYTRLAELFNVNNYIVSISQPYFAQLLTTEFKYRGQPRLWLKLVSLVRLSAQYRLGQLSDWGIISPGLKSLFIDEIIPGRLQVNVVPETDALFRDLMLVFDSTNIRQKVKHWIELGEISVWPQMSIIWARSRIEYVLEKLNDDL